MIGKTISTFDRVLPVEDTAHLLNILRECYRRPTAEELERAFGPGSGSQE